jgi:hypothetical protein
MHCIEPPSTCLFIYQLPPSPTMERRARQRHGVYEMVSILSLFTAYFGSFSTTEVPRYVIPEDQNAGRHMKLVGAVGSQVSLVQHDHTHIHTHTHTHIYIYI